MDQRPTTHETGAGPRGDHRRRQLIAGAVAVLLTGLTAVVGIGVNFGAASAKVTSDAGTIERTAVITDVGTGDDHESVDGAVHDAWGRPTPAIDQESREHERGHDDDD